MTPPQLATLGEVVAFLIGLGVVVAGLKWLVPIVRGLVGGAVRFIRGVADFLDSWHGVPEQRDASGSLVRGARPGVLHRLETSDDRIEGMTDGLAAINSKLAQHEDLIADVQHHVKPNSGTSAYDQMMRQLRTTDESVGTLRELMVGTIQELTEFRRDYDRALRVNHPDYRADRYSD